MTDSTDRNRPERRTVPLERARFRSPGASDRPGMRWWWQTPLPPEALVRELGAIAAAGFGEVEIAFVPGFWADEAQRAALLAVLTEAERLGVAVSTTLGAAWPLQTPNTSKGTAHAAQELQYGSVFISGAGGRKVRLPRPIDDRELERPSRLVSVSARRVLHRGEDPEVRYAATVFGERKYIHGPADPTTLDSSTFLDLGDAVTDGIVEWPGAEGDWALFAFWMRDSEQGVTSFLDRDAALAATEYLDRHQFDDRISEMLSRSGADLFEDSLELDADSLFWTPAFVQRFEAAYGYDIVPYLPGLFAHGMCRYWVPNEEPGPDFVFDDGSDARVRRDYHRFLTDLYIADHLAVLQEWSLQHGLRHKAQVAYGQNLEPIRANREFVRLGGHAEAESLNSGDRVPVSRSHPTWRFALDWQRSLVAGAHQGGATRISTELGAQFQAGYLLTLGDYRQLLDKEGAAGITRPFVHGYASQDPTAQWPTQHRFGDVIAESWNDLHFPEWVNWRPLNDYWARGTVVLETGTPRCDVAVYRDGFLTTAARGVIDVTEDFTAPTMLVDSDALERAGYSVQFIDPLALVEPEADGAGGVLYPDGPAYRALVIDHIAAMPAATAESIDRAAAGGLRVVVVGEPPREHDGHRTNGDEDDRVAAAFRTLTTRASFIAVERMQDAAVALRHVGLTPRAAWDDAPLLTQWRDAGERSYLILYNTSGEVVSTRISVEIAGALRELDLRSGELHRLPSEPEETGMAFTVEMGPLDLRMFEIDTTEAPVRPQPCETAASGQTVRELGDWDLTVNSETPGGIVRIALPSQGPGDWRDIDGLRDASGTGTYTARVALPAGTSASLSLGSIAGSAIVRVGGQEYGPAYVSGETLELGEALVGAEVLEIEVRTPLRNAVVASRMKSNIGTETMPHGLIGPVRLFTRATDLTSPRRNDVLDTRGEGDD